LPISLHLYRPAVYPMNGQGFQLDFVFRSKDPGPLVLVTPIPHSSTGPICLSQGWRSFLCNPTRQNLTAFPRFIWRQMMRALFFPLTVTGEMCNTWFFITRFPQKEAIPQRFTVTALGSDDLRYPRVLRFRALVRFFLCSEGLFGEGKSFFFGAHPVVLRRNPLLLSLGGGLWSLFVFSLGFGPASDSPIFLREFSSGLPGFHGIVPSAFVP